MDNLAVGRYRTVAKAEDMRDGTSASINRLTRRETVALMHATVTGIRQSTNWWVVGADRTQSIAIDEIFSGKKGNDDLSKRETVTLRNTKADRMTISHSNGSDSNSEEDVIEASTKVMKTTGLC